MKTWYIYRKPAAHEEHAAPAAAEEEYRLIPEGFSLLALLFGPFWLMVRSFWMGIIALAALLMLSVVIELGEAVYGEAHIKHAIAFACAVTANLFFGFFGYALEEMGARARGYQLCDVIIAPNHLAAELECCLRSEHASDTPARSPPAAARPFVWEQ